MEKELLLEIRQFLDGAGMAETYFGKRACGNSAVVERLKAGRTVTLRTAERIRAYIAAHSETPVSAVPPRTGSGQAG